MVIFFKITTAIMIYTSLISDTIIICAHDLGI
jgi:hypothetical protein